MDKGEFAAQLRKATEVMSEEEINRAMEALCACRSEMNRKNSKTKSETASLLATTEQNRSLLRIRRNGEETATLKVLGASVLTIEAFRAYADRLPSCSMDWWLYGQFVVRDCMLGFFASASKAAHIRPILIVEDAAGAGLRPGDVFFIRNEEMKLLSHVIAIRTDCLEDVCTFATERYADSMVRLCVEGWYGRLIRYAGAADEADCGMQPDGRATEAEGASV